MMRPGALLARGGHSASSWIAYLSFADIAALPPICEFARDSTAWDYGLQAYGIDQPRLVAGRGLLYEPSRTNHILYSNTMRDQGLWFRGNLTLAGAADPVFPGVSTVDRATETTADALHFTRQSIAATAGTAYSFSVAARRAVGTRDLRMDFPSATFGSEAFAKLNLGGGAIDFQGSGLTTALVWPLDGDWQRCAIGATCASSGTASQVFYMLNASGGVNYLGDGLSAIDLVGAQCEAGDQATSFIPTDDQPVTRAADSLTLLLEDGDYDVMVTREALDGTTHDVQQAITAAGGSGWSVPVDATRPYLRRIIVFPTGHLTG
jgi:hypothetical protein